MYMIILIASARRYRLEHGKFLNPFLFHHYPYSLCSQFLLRCTKQHNSDDDCNGGTCNTNTCTCSCLPCHDQVSAGCEFKCDCNDACNEGTCDNSKCAVCTPANADEKCSDDEDCIIAPGSTEGNCISSAICTDTKDDICDEAWSAVSGSGDGSAKCCPSTSSCIKSAIGVKATSTCSTSCGSSCLGATTKNNRYLPTTFCRFGTRIGKFISKGHCLYYFFICHFSL